MMAKDSGRIGMINGTIKYIEFSVEVNDNIKDVKAKPNYDKF
jgi:hypothetical protein